MTAATVVLGDEDLLVARAVQRAVSAAADVEVNDVLGSELDPGALDELVSPSLFSDDRLLVVRGIQDCDKDTSAALLRVVESGDDGLRLVLTHPGGAKGKATLDALRKSGAEVIDVPRVRSPREREQFVAEEIRAAGGTVDRGAVADIVAAIGTDLRELATAAAQLVADVGRQITTDDVSRYHRGRAESTGFAVADRAVEGDVAAAMETLRWAFSTGVDPVLVSSSLAANLRLIAVVASAGRGSPESLAGPLGLPPWKIRRAQGWQRRWRPDALADAVRVVATADADLKGAADDAAYAVERAVLAVAGAAAGG
jgi:DNA polymerase-3 subunit delta